VRKSAQSALDQLRRTAIPRRVLAISYQTGQVPNTCVVLPASASKGTFKLFIAWDPTNPSFVLVPHTVLEATINETSAKGDRFQVSSYGGRYGKPEPPAEKAKLIRAVLSRSAQQCEVLQNGQLQLTSSP
jgi:hypothetical protein